MFGITGGQTEHITIVMLLWMLDDLATGAAAYGVRLNERQLEQFRRYYALVVEWSRRVNLIGAVDEAVFVRRHVLESIAMGAALRERELLRPDMRALDLGSGAGFPGLPIKIVWPTVHITLLDATAKKTAFLSACVNALDLVGARVVTGRAEELARQPDLREQFDLVLARAVAPLRVLVELGLPFLRQGGRLATVKGSRASTEIADARNALELLHATTRSFGLNVPGPEQTLVAVLKEGPTLDVYPRRTGLPTKRPL
jgi:16S rRNA (guanine527-N7)-methyltransferase